jgi:hypothetical protein
LVLRGRGIAEGEVQVQGTVPKAGHVGEGTGVVLLGLSGW